MLALIDRSKVAIGGDSDASDKYISPTVLKDVVPDDAVMQEEIFGPVLPIFCVSSRQEAINFINNRCG